MRHKSLKATGDMPDVVNRDNLVKLVVDVPDTVKNRRWMKDFKNRWKVKLDQLELWMVSYYIEIE